MAAPNSKSAICNLSLDYLLQNNESNVTDIDSPNTPSELICARWYDECRRQLLRSLPWNFAIKRVVLTANATTPAFGYSVAFNVPNDFLRIVTVEPADNLQIYGVDKQYQFEDNQILTNGDSTTTLNLRYIYDFTNVVKMDALFIDLLAIDLALKMAYKFTSSNTNVERLKSLRDDKFRQASAIDGQERTPIRIEVSGARQARRRLGSNQRAGPFVANYLW